MQLYPIAAFLGSIVEFLKRGYRPHFCSVEMINKLQFTFTFYFA